MRNAACATLLGRFVEAIRTTQPECFARRRGIMAPAVAMLSLLWLTAVGCCAGYEPLMASLYARLAGQLGWKQTPAASTFCRARSKITPLMLMALRDEIYRIAKPTLALFAPTIRGHRVVAIDGSWITVPRSKLLCRFLGIHRIGPNRTKMKNPQVLLVVLTDALSRAPIARVILPGNGSEREAAATLLKHLHCDDLLLVDRGYHGRDLLLALHHTGCRFIARVPGGSIAMRELRPLQRRRIRDARVTIQHRDVSQKLRHVRISGGPGRPRRKTRRETQFLLTNLPGSWSPKRIGNVYRCRWGIETMFRELKATLAAEKMHARSMDGVIQELDARMLHLGMATFLDIAAIVAVFACNDRQRRHQTHHTNRTVLLTLIAAALEALYGKIPERIENCANAAEQAARIGQRRRFGRYAERAGKMFIKYGKVHHN